MADLGGFPPIFGNTHFEVLEDSFWFQVILIDLE